MTEGAEPQQFADGLGSPADGVIVGGYWDASFSYPGARALAAEYVAQNGGSYSQHIADSYTAAKVLMDAMAKAGSTDPEKLNTAIGKTDATYPVGPVKLGADHTAVLQLVEPQWQNGTTKVVWPADRKNGSLLFPIPAS